MEFFKAFRICGFRFRVFCLRVSGLRTPAKGYSGFSHLKTSIAITCSILFTWHGTCTMKAVTLPKESQ